MSMHADVCKDLCEQVWDDPTFLLQIITKSYGYNSDTRQQFSQWKTFQCPRPKKGRLVNSVTMNMLLVFSENFSLAHSFTGVRFSMLNPVVIF